MKTQAVNFLTTLLAMCFCDMLPGNVKENERKIKKWDYIIQKKMFTALKTINKIK